MSVDNYYGMYTSPTITELTVSGNQFLRNSNGLHLTHVHDSVVIGNQLYNLNQSVRDRKPSRKLSSGQGGARFKAVLGDVDLSLNYFYGFSADTGAKVRSTEIVGNTLNVAVDLVNPIDPDSGDDNSALDSRRPIWPSQSK